MSSEKDKFKNSKRRLKDDNAVQKQLKIAKEALNAISDEVKDVQQPHRLVKKHAMDCGKPNCTVCGNPRKIFKELTQQEKRMFQDTDQVRNKKTNGIGSKDE